LLGVHRHVALDDGRCRDHIQVGLALQQIGLLEGQRKAKCASPVCIMAERVLLSTTGFQVICRSWDSPVFQ
jgi:hypothetical protein